jgi:hypothetical protein
MEDAPWKRRVGYAHCDKFSESPRRVAALLRPKSTQSPNLLTSLYLLLEPLKPAVKANQHLRRVPHASLFKGAGLDSTQLNSHNSNLSNTNSRLIKKTYSTSTAG